MFSKLNKYFLVLLTVFAIGLLLWGRPTVTGDGYYNYSIYDMFTKTGKVTTTNPVRYTQFASWALGSKDGINYSSIAYPGTAIMWSPFMLTLSLIDHVPAVTKINDYLVTTTGVPIGEGLGVLVASAFYACMSVYLSFLWLAKYFSKRNAFLSALAIFIAQYGFFYAFTDPSYTHAVTGFICALAFYLFDRLGKQRSYLILGLVLGLGTLVRIENILFAIPFACYLLWRKQYKQLVYYGLGTGVVLLIIPIYSYFAYGNPFTNGYAAIGGQAGGFSLHNFFIFNLLFSDIRGLLIWSPLVIFGFLGLLINLYKRWQLKYTFLSLGVIGLFLVFYNFWYAWWCGGSAGQRYLFGLFPLFAFGLASFNHHLFAYFAKQRYIKFGWVGIIIIAMFVSIFVGRVYANFDTSNFQKFPYQKDVWGSVPATEQYSFTDLLGLGYREYGLSSPNELIKLPIKLVVTPHHDGRRSLLQMLSLVSRTQELQNGTLIAVRTEQDNQIIYKFDTSNFDNLTVEIHQDQVTLASETFAARPNISIICKVDYSCQLGKKTVQLNDKDVFEIFVFDNDHNQIKLSKNQIYFSSSQLK